MHSSSQLTSFSSLAAMDRVGSIATNLPPSIADHEIETPFPPSYFISFESVVRSLTPFASSRPETDERCSS